MNDPVITKLEEMLSKQHLHRFDKEEVEVLHRVIALVRGFDTLGSLAGFVTRSITWFGIVIGAIIAVRSGLIDFIVQSMAERG